VAFLILRACIAGLGLFEGAALQFQRQNYTLCKGAIKVNTHLKEVTPVLPEKLKVGLISGLNCVGAGGKLPLLKLKPPTGALAFN
jgi:hypothetical protein